MLSSAFWHVFSKQLLQYHLKHSGLGSGLLGPPDLILLPRSVCLMENVRYSTIQQPSSPFPHLPSSSHFSFLPLLVMISQKMTSAKQLATFSQVCLLPLGVSVSMACSPLPRNLQSGSTRQMSLSSPYLSGKKAPHN